MKPLNTLNLSGLALFIGVGLAAGANDDFADADLLAGALPIMVVDENANESAEPGEPDHDFDSLTQNSIWWHWTPSSDIAVEINTFGSTPIDALPGLQFDTVLAVYTGTSINNIVKVIGNDDTPDPSNSNTKQSLVRFFAEGGTKYYIVVDGYRGDTGNVRLNVLAAPSPQPSNDNLADAVEITSALPWDNSPGAEELPETPSGPINTNVNGTAEELEPEHVSESAFSSSIWYKWVASADGAAAALTDGSSFDTVLAVYSGTGLGNLTLVGENDDHDGLSQSLVEFFATVGTTYYFAVDGFAEQEGDVHFRLQWGPDAPPNDDVNNTAPEGLLASDIFVSTNGPSGGATIEVGEPPHHDAIAPSSSIWYRWTAPVVVPDSIEMNTYGTFANPAGSNYDTILAVYTGSPFGGFTKIASNNNAGGIQSRVRFQPVPGELYRIVIAGNEGAQGAAFLNILPGPTAPSNDDFLNATEMGTGTFASGNNAGATVQFGEPEHVPGITNYGTVWFRWTATLSTRYRVKTEGSDFDTTLAVYSGQAVDALTQLGSNDNAGGFTSQLTFDTDNGETYYIAVGGKELAEGNINLSIESIGSYAFWLENNPGLTGPAQEQLADADGDGYPNLIEMLCGLDPFVNSRPEVDEDPNASNAPVFTIAPPASVLASFTIDPTYIGVSRNGGDPVTFWGQIVGEDFIDGNVVTPFNFSGNDYTMSANFSATPMGTLVLRVSDPNSDP